MRGVRFRAADVLRARTEARTSSHLTSRPAPSPIRSGQGSPDEKNGCCTSPLVRPATCAADLRKLCSATSPAHSRYLKYAFSPGGCSGDPGNLTYPLQDLANFQLVRGDYALLGHGWLGACARGACGGHGRAAAFRRLSPPTTSSSHSHSCRLLSRVRGPGADQLGLWRAHRALPRDCARQRRLHARLHPCHRRHGLRYVDAHPDAQELNCPENPLGGIEQKRPACTPCGGGGSLCSSSFRAASVVERGRRFPKRTAVRALGGSQRW